MKSKALGQRDILLEIVKLFDRYKVPYLLSGSFASSYYGQPRATHDIDFVVEVKRENLDRLRQATADLGKDYDVPAAGEWGKIRSPRMISVYHFATAIKVDFWLTDTDDFAGKYKRRKQIEINRERITIVSAEDLILTKLCWCREVRSERHLSDCIGIWRVQKGKLDENYLLRKAGELGVTDFLSEVAEGDLTET